jgi:hypothetical protein
VERKVTLPTNAPVSATALLRQLCPPMRLPMGLILFLLLLDKTLFREAQEGPDMVIGMFFINDTSAIVLFDSGASHSFISAAYVENHNLP